VSLTRSSAMLELGTVVGGTASRAASVWSQTAGFSKTARSDALRGGLIEGHTVARITRMPIVDRSDAGITGTAATTRQGRSAAPFFRADERLAAPRCRPSQRGRSLNHRRDHGPAEGGQYRAIALLRGVAIVETGLRGGSVCGCYNRKRCDCTRPLPSHASKR
jgi:hypothetical protein